MNLLGDALSIGSFGLLDEDTLGGIPGLSAITGSMPDEYKNLLRMQQKLAEDAKKQRERSHRAGLNALGQSLLAFNPRNQMMAEMFGPEAAFTPDQFAAMAADPFGGPPVETPKPGDIDFKAVFENGGKLPPQGDPMLDPGYLARKQQWEQEERERLERLRAGIAPLPPGPAPIGGPMPIPRRRG